ncbi:hypothetical protein GOP47_0016774 [Adiantum capillus-veneris]|uniref:Sucrose-phosphatase n=1 Tax=Adiantum capillus-veneris TaxID=13818 RepID=A0A9D4UJ38_ADICA|nr:hypothetical protein GOP47_0016774 [Adiantum capillus-veneris]
MRFSRLPCTTPLTLCWRSSLQVIVPRLPPFRAFRFSAPSSVSMYAKCCTSSEAFKGHLMLVSDLDLTMVDHEDSTHRALLDFNCLWASEYGHNSHLVYSSGRSMQRYLELEKVAPLLTPDVLILSVGTEIRLGTSLEVDKAWAKELDDGWNRDIIVEEALKLSSLRFQEEPDQGLHKVSFKVDRAKGQDMQETFSKRLSERGLRVKVLYSSGIDLDVLPYKAGKGQALAYLLKKLNQNDITHKNVLVCGDSGNDIDLFTVEGVHGVIVANAQEELERWHQLHGSNANIFRASQRCAGGIMEALQYFRFGPQLHLKDKANHESLPLFAERSVPFPAAVHREVVEFNEFMINWLLGEVSNTESSFARLSGVISDQMKAVLPEGIELTAEELLCKLRKEYGSIQVSGLRTWLDKINEQKLAEGVYLVTWQTWEQPPAGEKKGYFTSAVLKPKAGTTNGLEWLHFHKTFRSTNDPKRPQM